MNTAIEGRTLTKKYFLSIMSERAPLRAPLWARFQNIYVFILPRFIFQLINVPFSASQIRNELITSKSLCSRPSFWSFVFVLMHLLRLDRHEGEGSPKADISET